MRRTDPKNVVSIHFPFVPTSPRLGFRHRSPSTGLGLRPHALSPIQHLRLSAQGCLLVIPWGLTMARDHHVKWYFEAFFVRKVIFSLVSVLFYRKLHVKIPNKSNSNPKISFQKITLYTNNIRNDIFRDIR